MNQSFQSGFLKRAAEHGLNPKQANSTLDAWMKALREKADKFSLDDIPPELLGAVGGGIIGAPLGALVGDEGNRMSSAARVAAMGAAIGAARGGRETGSFSQQFIKDHPDAIKNMGGAALGSLAGAYAAPKGRNGNGALIGALMGGLGTSIGGHHDNRLAGALTGSGLGALRSSLLTPPVGRKEIRRGLSINR